MEKYFVSYDEAFALRDIGFDEPCLSFHCEDKDGKKCLIPIVSTVPYVKGFVSSEYPDLKFGDRIDILIAAPMYQQAFEWFREKKRIVSFIYTEATGSDEWVYAFETRHLPLEFEDEKRRGQHIVYKSSYSEYGSYSGGWNTYAEAQSELLKQLIKMAKTIKTGYWI